MSVEVQLFGDFDIRGVPLRVSASFDEDGTIFEARLGDLTLGEVIAWVVGLAVPSLEVTFPPPWDVLASVSLRDLVLRMDVTHGTLGVVHEHVGLDLGFLKLDALELTYGPSAADGDASVSLKLFGRLLDRSYPYPDRPLTWDLLDEPPPAVPPAGNPEFRLDYLGLGQRVTLRDPSKLGDMASVVEALAEAGADVPDTADPVRELPTLRFDAAAGWLVGASFSVLDTLRILAVFNDPDLYGLRVELSGERAKQLAGLELEILYRKVGPGLGVYHLELELPESMRHLELGAASVTMPYAVVDVWTNGNFMVDLGFPHGLDFSRSFTFQTFVGPVPVIGAGGFYFGVLGPGTATGVPAVSNGRFAPVLAFGVGLQLAVGRTIEMGLLRAGIVIGVEGLLEGVIGFFKPEDPGVGSDVWYRVRGTLALVGHIYGEVSFAIVKARVDIRAYASASITLEAYAATEVVLEAGVRVELKVKVAFIHIHLSFDARVRQSLTLGKAGHPPWRLREGGESAWLRALEAPGAFGSAGLMDAPAPPASVATLLAAAGEDRWAAARVCREVRTLDLYLQPTVTVGTSGDRPEAGEEGKAAVQVLALLMIPRGRTLKGPAGLDDLAWAALRWAVAGAEGEDLIDRVELARAFHDLVASGDPERVGFCDIVDFLRENFRLRIRGLPTDPERRAALRDDGLTLFPVPPWLSLHAELAGHRADLEHLNPCSPEYRALVDDYFRRLHPDPPPAGEGGTWAAQGAAAPLGAREASAPPASMAAFVFADAARLVLRGILRAGLDAFDGWEAEAEADDRLDDIARRYGAGGPEAPDELALANQDAPGFWSPGSSFTLTGLRARVRDGESPADVSGRWGLEAEALARAAADAPGLLRPGSALRIEGGRVVTGDADTVQGLAGRLSTSVEALLAANPWLPWPPPPDGGEVLPPGQEVAAPTLDARVAGEDTLSRLADRFGVSVEGLLTHPDNVGSPEVLAPGATLPLPPIHHAVEEGDTPASLARRLGMPVRALVRLADAGGATYGRVRVPGCRRVPAEALRAAMVEGGAFDAVAGSMARFLLAGLRLPDPGSYPRGIGSGAGSDWSGMPLFPLYVLTGQQWTCADGDPAAERVTLSRNPDDPDAPCRRPLITFDSDTPDEGLTVGLGAEEVALVQAYRPLAASGRPLDPQLLAATREAPFVVVPRRFPLGEAVSWHAASVPGWAEGAETAGDPVILPLPGSLASLLREVPGRTADPRLVVRPPAAPGEAPHAACDVDVRAWATRVELEVRRAPDPGRPGAFLPSVVEVFGSDGGGRRRLLELIEHLRDHPERVARIHLLRASDPTAPGGAALRSDAVEPGEVVLLKTNLSTWTRPPAPELALMARVGAEPAEVPVHASMAEPLPFLQLLWEASVVAAGGFHLVYPAGEGGALPEGLFESRSAARLTVLVVVSPSAESQASVPAEPFHDCVLAAEAPGEGTPSVEPPLFNAGAPVSLPDLAASLGVEAAGLALANASVRGLVAPGTSLALPGGGRWIVQPGDDLLSIAMALPDPSLGAVAEAVAAAGPAIAAGTRGWTHPAWTRVLPTLGPGRVGLRVLRTDPDPEPVRAGADGVERSGQDDPATRLRALYNLMDARVEKHGPFPASPRTLPAAPGRTEDPGGLNPTPETPPAPWSYERILGVAGLAGPPGGGAGEVDPYAGLGEEALASIRFLDVFGNRCLPGDALPTITAPIRYTDALVGPGHWPGVAVSFRFVRGAGPRLRLSTTLDVVRTSPAPGGPFAPVRARATADRATFAVARRQLERDDLSVTVASTLDSEPQPLDRPALAAFLRGVDRWLATVEALEVPREVVRPDDTPASVASRWRIPLDALAAANVATEGLLAPGTGTLQVPRLHVTARGDTLAGVAGDAAGAVTPAELGRLNQAVRLRTDVPLTVDGAPVPVPRGATLASVARDAGVDVQALAEENAEVPDLFDPGTRLLTGAGRGDVPPGATLASLAAEHGLGAADLLAANAATSGLLAIGAAVTVPDHVSPGADSGATARVARGDTLASLAHRLGLEVVALVQANLAMDGLLAVREPPTMLEAVAPGGATVRTRVLAGDTMATALHRLRAQPGCEALDAAALAGGNADRQGLLAEGAVVLTPPAGREETVPVAADYADVIFPVRVWMDLARPQALVDPVLPTDSPVHATRTRLSPSLGGAGERRGARDLRGFARDFQEAFPELRLATSAGTAQAGQRIALFAVQLQNQTVSWRIGSTPVFFAPRPLLTTRWSTPDDAPAPIRPYAGGALGEPTPTAIHGVDLDVWGRELLEAVDRLLVPDHAVTAEHLCAAASSDAYDRVVRAKAALASALRGGVEPVLEPSDEGAAGDVEAAREAFYQRVLRELAEAYRIDAIVQLPVTVHAPFEDLERAPRLHGRVVSTTYVVPPGATLGSAADDLRAPVTLLVRFIAPVGALLVEGASVTVDGRSHVVGSADTLATVAAALGVDLDSLARSLEDQEGLLRPGAPLDLFGRRHPIGGDETLGDVIETLADGWSAAEAVATFAAMNAEVGALLRKGVAVRVTTVPVREGDTLASLARGLGTTPEALGTANADTQGALRPGAVVQAGGATREVREGDTLGDVAADLGLSVPALVAEVADAPDLLARWGLVRRVRPLEGNVGAAGRLDDLARELGASPEDVVASLLDTRELLRPGTEARWLERRPALSLSEVKVPLAEGASLTFLLRASSARRQRRIALAPELWVTAVEHDVRDVPWAGAYQASEWLTLVEPVRDPLHTMDVPVPLRAHPLPPVILGQEIRPLSPTIPTFPTSAATTTG